MSRISTRTRRIVTAAGVIAAGGTLALLAPTAAFASQQTAGTVPANGGILCTYSQYASYQVRADGNAFSPGARFLVYRNGAEVYRTPTGKTTGFAYEGRTSYGTFAGPGYYQVCAKNNNATNTYVSNLQLRTDGEFF